MRTKTTILLAILLLLLAAACGGDDKKPDDVGADDGDATEADASSADDENEDDGDEGSDEGEGDGESAAFAQAIADTFDDTGTATTPEQRLCAGEAFVEIIGADTLAASGAVPADVARSNPADYVDVTEDQAEQFIAAIDGCGIDIEEEFINNLSTEAPDPAATEECLRSEVDADLVNDFFVASFTLPSEEVQADPRVAALLNVFQGCSTPS